MPSPHPVRPPDFVAPDVVRSHVHAAMTGAEFQEFDRDYGADVLSFVESHGDTLRGVRGLALAESHYETQARAAQRWRTVLRRRLALRVISAAVLLGSLIAVVSAISGSNTIYPVWWRSYAGTAQDHVYVGLSIALALTIAFCAAAVQLLGEESTRRSASRKAAEVAEQRVGEARPQIEEEVRLAVEGLVRAAVNQLDVEAARLRDLDATVAPALIELSSSEIVNAQGLGRVEGFLTRHPSSAVGVAGTRGVGKSTIMRRLCTPADGRWLGVYLQTPVLYDQVGLVRLIHAETARAVLRDSGEVSGDRRLDADDRASAARLLVPSVASVIGLVVFLIDVLAPKSAPGVPPSFFASLSALGTGGLVVTAAAFVWALAVIPRRTPLQRIAASRSSSRSAQLAALQLERLEWRRSGSSSRKISMKLANAVTTEGDARETRTERERSHPELVADFRNFLLQLRETGAKPVVIAIDELDKIASGSDAIEFINGIKDLFHVEGSHFLISVSEDALVSFGLRGVPVRDVFDSAFDDVIRIDSFSLDETRQLLSQRVVKFPEVAVLLCHALSGGLPREVLRTARQCVEYRHKTGATVKGEHLAAVIIREELKGVLEGYRVRHPERVNPRVSAALGQVQDTLVRPDSPEDGVRAASALADNEGGPWDDLPNELYAVWAVLVLVVNVLSSAMERSSWRDAVTAPEMREIAAELCALRRKAGTRPREALDGVAELRLRAG